MGTKENIASHKKRKVRQPKEYGEAFKSNLIYLRFYESDPKASLHNAIKPPDHLYRSTPQSRA